MLTLWPELDSRDCVAMELSVIQKIAIWILPLLFAITLHEVAHGWVASYFGDQTARLSGRLSLNPIKHIDPFGTVIMPLMLLLLTQFQFAFGWAKPVPVDMRNLNHPRRDMALVALAGPMANVLMALFWGAMMKVGMLSYDGGNFWLGVPLMYMGNAGVMINIVLGVLNLVPLPPLDGGKIMMSLVPPHVAFRLSLVIEPYGFLILILLLVTGILSSVISPFVYLLVNLINNLYGLY
ncbi:site-2 protease family protein [Aquicella lusitana]|uniref:Zn-dependent protease n=1 Tax=Aquicella lusitana TaxID=254246 RepID=A0A370G5U4_9COXI|nr:site-2 protease family protein [Aquicella lusitana]RDI39201.1 Zn-dependent protease [Aquicella lusitana]VVC74060.1 hypothetical protein AQULUS_18230 [Aquicella lusitana]